MQRQSYCKHDDVIKWKHFPRNWPFVRGIHRSPVNSPHKGQWRGALMFSLICVWINGWVNNREAGDLRRNRGHYDVIVMKNKTLLHMSSRSSGNPLGDSSIIIKVWIMFIIVWEFTLQKITKKKTALGPIQYKYTVLPVLGFPYKDKMV